MSDLTTYSLADFFPITREVYFRLFVRLNEGVWPAHILAAVVGIACIWRALHGRGRTVGILLGICWAFVGWTYHLTLYAPLNWGATYAGWAFIAQGALLVAYGLLGRLDRPEDRPLDPPGWMGIGLAILALAVFPLVGPLAGRSWAGVQIFGIAPDPTVIATIGLVLAAAETRWLLLVIPLLWCLVAGATGLVLDTPSGLATAVAGAAGLVVAVWTSTRRRIARSNAARR